MRMKYWSIISSAVALFLAATIHIAAQDQPSADVILQKVADKLASAKNLTFEYKRELNYQSEGYLSKTTAQGFLDLKPGDVALGFRFQFSNDDTLAIYNGTEKFFADKKKKTIIVENNPTIKAFAGFSFFYNSPITLKNVLPKIIADNTIEKKVSVIKIEGVDHYMIEFTLNKASIDPLGEIYQLKSERKSVYQLTVNKETLLPIELFAGNDKNKDFARTDFVSIKENGAEPLDTSWYYSTYSKNYKLEVPGDRILIKNGQTAPEFKLTRSGSDTQMSLGDYKGKTVLLEFWIANCGFCIGAVPKINSIAAEFKTKGLEVVSINVHDPQKLIDIFKNNNKPGYGILTGGEETGIKYGVSAFPSFVLVDKNGKVVYSSAGLDEKELEAIIAKNF